MKEFSFSSTRYSSEFPNYAEDMINERLDWTWSKGGIWTTCSEVALHIGVSDKIAAGVIGKLLRKHAGVKWTRSNGKNLVYVPRP